MNELGPLAVIFVAALILWNAPELLYWRIAGITGLVALGALAVIVL